jgi:hypothetical protein
LRRRRKASTRRGSLSAAVCRIKSQAERWMPILAGRTSPVVDCA